VDGGVHRIWGHGEPPSLYFINDFSYITQSRKPVLQLICGGGISQEGAGADTQSEKRRIWDDVFGNNEKFATPVGFEEIK
jgi:hypothetical protein